MHAKINKLEKQEKKLLKGTKELKKADVKMDKKMEALKKKKK